MPSDGKVEIAKAKSRMKATAKNGFGNPSQIYHQVQSTLSDEARLFLPQEESCKRSIRRILAKHHPNHPQSLNDLAIENEWILTAGPNPERFLLYDNGINAPNRIIIFATDENLRMLCSSNCLFMDGTFKTAPKLFLQMYTIQATLGDSSVPLVFAFLQRNNKQTYNELLRVVLGECALRELLLMPEVIHIDFEQAVITAWRAIYGVHVYIKCCFFHLTQNTWRHIQRLGLTQLYTNDDNFKHFCGMIDGLAFLPIQDVGRGMELLRQPRVLHPDAIDLLNYFDQTYVSGTLIENRIVPPVFPPELWNVYHETTNNFPRTNNFSEAWNLKFQVLVARMHPTIWKSINAIQLLQETTKTKILQNSIGQPPRKRVKRVYQQLQQRLSRLCFNYTEGEIDLEAFLRGIGRNIRF